MILNPVYHKRISYEVLFDLIYVIFYNLIYVIFL